jgi:hypothetical protein
MAPGGGMRNEMYQAFKDMSPTLLHTVYWLPHTGTTHEEVMQKVFKDQAIFLKQAIFITHVKSAHLEGFGPKEKR